MAQEPTFSDTTFPSASKVGETFYHKVTGQTYVYGGNEKRSWRLVSDIENRTYTGPSAPDETIENLKDGDLWWDNEHFELRVYHKVLLAKDEGTGQKTYSEGVWVSSTHPMMDPDEPEKQKQFGLVVVTPARRTFTEGSEFKFDAHLPHHNVPFDQWKVTATVDPPYLGGNPDATSAYNNVFINFDDTTGEINGSLVCGYYPINDADFNNNETRKIQVKITVQAHTDLEDEAAEEFYADFYETETYGGFTGQVEHLPSYPPLIVETIPFKEQLSDTLADHAGVDVDLDSDEYQKVANETIRFVPVVTDPQLKLNLTGRIDGAVEYNEDGQYPLANQLPNVVLSAIHGGAKQLIMLFKYGNDPLDPIAGNYADNDPGDEYGRVRDTWQTDYLAYNNVQGVLDNMRIAFYVDGEDNESIVDGVGLYTTRFTDMGLVTKFTADINGNPVSIEGQFIGVMLNADNTSMLKVTNGGQLRLYFACLKPEIPGVEPTKSELDIYSSTKGYIDIENFTPAG